MKLAEKILQALDATANNETKLNTIKALALEEMRLQTLKATPARAKLSTTLTKMYKDNAKLEVKSGAYDGKLFNASEIDVLAKLPNREQALTMLASVLQAPVSKFARLLTALKEQQEAKAA